MKRILILATVAFITLNSCKKSEKPDDTFNGPDIQMGSGMAHSFISINSNGVPTVIGIEMTNEVLSGLPTTNFSSLKVINPSLLFRFNSEVRTAAAVIKAMATKKPNELISFKPDQSTPNKSLKA